MAFKGPKAEEGFFPARCGLMNVHHFLVFAFVFHFIFEKDATATSLFRVKPTCFQLDFVLNSPNFFISAFSVFFLFFFKINTYMCFPVPLQIGRRSWSGNNTRNFLISNLNAVDRVRRKLILHLAGLHPATPHFHPNWMTISRGTGITLCRLCFSF